MLVWIALLIPLVAIVAMAAMKPKKLVLWEMAATVVSVALLIALSKAAAEGSSARDHEYWGGWVVEARAYEAWDEETSCSHAEYETVSCGDDCTMDMFVGYAHLYDVYDHPEEYWAYGSNGEQIRISEDTYIYFAKKFGNSVFRDLARDYHSYDGDVYDAHWRGEHDRMQDVTTEHPYENKVQVARSVYSYPSVDKETTGVFDYPENSTFNADSVLGLGPSAGRDVEKLNAILGAKKQVRVWVIVFKDMPIQASFDQEAHWKGGNKNEFVVTVSISPDGGVQWARVFSWSDSEQLKKSTETFLLDQGKLDIPAFAKWLAPEIESKWARKEFAEFSYLTVEPSNGWVIATYALSLLATVSILFFAVNNKFDNLNTESRTGLWVHSTVLRWKNLTVTRLKDLLAGRFRRGK